MRKNKKKELSFVETLKKLTAAGISQSPVPNRTSSNLDNIASVEDRITFLFNIVRNTNRPPSNMLFFVMYDIESNKVRSQIVKYLINKGCYRVQKSIFLGDTSSEIYQQIRSDLTEVQACYENHDSILIVPISTDYLNSMKVIGQSIDVDLITHKVNTLFF